MKRYNPKDIEPRWQAKWAADKLYEVTEDPGKPKSYVTAMFPYPSGAGLHVGHVRNYSITDAIARFERQNGKNVLSTIGWDGFGLPAENYAIKTGTPPAISTAQNIANFKSQLSRLGMSYDWSREVNTTDPSYYKWTQLLFTKLFEKDLAYQKESLQWWCPHDKTVLANEQVEGGRCWRCGNEVVKKSMKQWFFRITAYADELLDGIADLEWPEKIKTMQRNWIGRSQGAQIDFAVDSNANYVDLHGFMGTPQSDFHPWLAEKVKALGATIQTPDLPNTNNPTVLEQSEFVLQQCTFDENTVLIGHSLGTAVALKVVEQLKSPIRRLVLVAAFAQSGFLDEERPFEKTFDWNFDFEKIKQNVHEIVILRAENDSAVPKERADYLSQKLDAPIVDFVAQENHVCGTQEPEVLRQAVTSLSVFTTRADTLYGATFLVVAPEHPLLEQLTTDDRREAVMAYRDAAIKKSEIERQENKDKTGEFTGSYAINPINGAKVPIWVADYVLYGYGTGAIMAVPAHDERDNEFAKAFDLPIVRVVQNDAPDDACSHDEGTLMNSGDYDGMPTAEARERIVADLEQQGIAEEKVNYKMRDWLISRQRYWGAPIPIIHCPEHGAVAVPESELPVVLPEVANYEPDGSGKGVLAKETDWVNTTCPQCGGPALRETDTMDGYVDSSWYLFRYADAHNDQAPWDPAKVNYWAPLDFYCGGDHAVAHLLYVRFWTKVFRDMDLLDFDEPIRQLVYNGYIYASDGTKMSKSKGNVVDPVEVIDSGYGADALRTYELFIGPYEQDTAWDAGGVAGTYRFLNRVWTLVQKFQEAQPTDTAEDMKLRRVMHRTVKKVSQDLGRQNFNTAIAAMMECVNELYKLKVQPGFTADWQDALSMLVQLMAPFAPHIAEELWLELGNEGSVHVSPWPRYDEQYLVSDTVTIAVQVNGKLRATVELPADVDEKTAVEAAKKDSNVAAHLEGKNVLRAIYVPHKLVNLVVK